jgi:hypothetical protein
MRSTQLGRWLLFGVLGSGMLGSGCTATVGDDGSDRASAGAARGFDSPSWGETADAPSSGARGGPADDDACDDGDAPPVLPARDGGPPVHDAGPPEACAQADAGSPRADAGGSGGSEGSDGPCRPRRPRCGCAADAGAPWADAGAAIDAAPWADAGAAVDAGPEPWPAEDAGPAPWPDEDGGPAPDAGVADDVPWPAEDAGPAPPPCNAAPEAADDDANADDAAN